MPNHPQASVHIYQCFTLLASFTPKDTCFFIGFFDGLFENNPQGSCFFTMNMSLYIAQKHILARESF